jgi:membrane-associated phospholipid phosphatase
MATVHDGRGRENTKDAESSERAHEPEHEKTREKARDAAHDTRVHAEQAAHELQRNVQRERVPRRRALRRGRVLLVGYALALAAVVALALAAHMATTSGLPGDLPFTRELQENHNPVVFGALYFVSYIGFAPLSYIVPLVVLLGLVAARLRLEALFLALSLLADVLGGLIKLVVGRQRPGSNLVHVVEQINSPSFPSGHTLHYTVFFGFLAFVLWTSCRRSWGRNLLVAICALLVLLVGPSRVYLGEHWASDVVGGYLIGGLCLVPLVAGYLWAKARFDSATLRRVRRQRGEN